MANDNKEEEVKELKVQNNELVQKVQFWKMKAAQQENDKLELMKENNELRLKLSRMRSGGAAQARALDAALQSASEEALSHLVQASSAVARTMELAKTYMKNRQDLELVSSRWSTLSNTPVKDKVDKVHKVPPTMMGGRTTQPFVSLNRVPLSNNSTPASRSPNQNQNVTERVLPMPMHILQDVYIPLRRIDTSELNNYDGTNDNAEENEIDELLVEENAELNDESQNMDEDDFEMSRQLEVLHEDTEEIEEESEPTLVNRSENPLEGPSWLLDNVSTPRPSPVLMKSRGSRTRVTLEADSTTEPDESVTYTPPAARAAPPPRATPPPPRAATPPPAEPPSPPQLENIPPPQLECRAFTPTVRRRKRTSSPPRSPEPDPEPGSASQTLSSSRESQRVLKVLVPKMSVSGDEREECPSKRRAEAPSYCGATDDAVRVLEQRGSSPLIQEGESSNLSSGSRDSDGDAPRARRSRKQVTYKEKPLNRKLRR
ncbi:histone H3.v1 isoform X1 [Plutella xylostella]|uniref:histone H3.v1 isoform X1 n=1 Tax=Plutella xylostella TaxID=51655 RepID=UPI00203300A6|nr:histone H3.v1 isoform X1 [Plutella xylostella]